MFAEIKNSNVEFDAVDSINHYPQCVFMFAGSPRVCEYTVTVLNLSHCSRDKSLYNDRFFSAEVTLEKYFVFE